MNISLPDLTDFTRAFVAALPAAVAVIIGAIAVRFVINRGLTLLAARTSLTHADVAPLRKIAGWSIFGATTVLLLSVFGFNLGGLWAVLSTVLGLVAIGFVAVWSVLSNVSCTMMILFFRPFSVGDELQFAGEPVKGRVVDLNFLYTTLETDDDALLQIPNNLFFQKVVVRRPSSNLTAPSLAEQLNRNEPARKVA